MATTRDARRALARGDVDGALVLLWNAIEPLRIRGDRAGLEEVERLAAVVAGRADGAYGAEAERLRAEVRETLGEGAAPPATVQLDAELGGFGEPLPLPPQPGAPPAPPPPAGETGPGDADGEEAGERPGGRRLGTLLWAAFVALVIILNVIGGLRGE